MVVNAKKALNDVTKSSYSTNIQAFSDAEVSSLNAADATSYVSSFATYQYQSYNSIYDGNPQKYGAYIDGWINRINELLDDKQKNFTSPKQKKIKINEKNNIFYKLYIIYLLFYQEQFK